MIKNDEGKLLLYYRDGYTKVCVAVADSYDSKFEVIGKDILPDGSCQILQRRERPMLLEDESGLYLFTTAKIGGEDILTGGQTWNMVQKIKQS